MSRAAACDSCRAHCSRGALGALAHFFGRAHVDLIVRCIGAVSVTVETTASLSVAAMDILIVSDRGPIIRRSYRCILLFRTKHTNYISVHSVSSVCSTSAISVCVYACHRRVASELRHCDNLSDDFVCAFWKLSPYPKKPLEPWWYFIRALGNHGQFLNLEFCVLCNFKIVGITEGVTLLWTLWYFFLGQKVRKAKTSIAQKYNRKEGGTTANFQNPSFAVLLTFR